MKIDIPSVDDFDLIKKKKIESDDHWDKLQKEQLEEKIYYQLSTGSFDINKNKITFKISGYYNNNIIESVRKTMIEKGWKKFIVEKDTEKKLFFSKVIIEK